MGVKEYIKVARERGADALGIANDPESICIIAEMTIAKYYQTKDTVDLGNYIGFVGDVILSAAADEEWINKQLERIVAIDFEEIARENPEAAIKLITRMAEIATAGNERIKRVDA